MNNKGDIAIYKNDNGNVKLEVRFQDEDVWLTQLMMAELYQTTKQNIGQHLKNIFEEGELDFVSVVKKFFTTAADGKQYLTTFYNLDAIISVGYRVKSISATHFRIWATRTLKEYLIKGFVLNDEKLKNPPVKGKDPLPDYFDELIERIRDIRASERRMYLRVREIFKLAADYEPSDGDTQNFFATIQNKLHFAITGKTAAEIIFQRASAELPNMGLTSWQKEEIRKYDVTIAKNYLAEEEIDQLNRIVVMWLDYAEDQAKRRKQVFMKDWSEKLDSFLSFNERDILKNAGSISSEQAKKHAQEEYEEYARLRREYKESLTEQEIIKELENKAKEAEN